ncbi:chromosome segregation protein SMC [Verminephrobacter aporrectodeae subsp. tuberculatae]|uniref:Chromosome segregation protein SMC n=1 Tax=Verminephrobacter aporrectodeae subsp. tuberculatae TaxID=1110392 RepID=A0ABT3KVY5_9BURK|nr:AAA family ATPase [Verminephrobacter aporrectodeae]MCW5321965.1 chromosome segregation protein SMC [Verminephrobacter aporrectodeae subsp. tuberculatae]
MLIKSIKLTNFLSYGDHSESIPLGPLNVIIGPNGSGKSNLLEAIELLKSAPKDLIVPIRDGGGVRNWLWKGCTPPMPASLEAVIYYQESCTLRYSLSFTEVSQRFERIEESIEETNLRRSPFGLPDTCYKFQNGIDALRGEGSIHKTQREYYEPNQSILSQRKGSYQYPELTFLSNTFTKIRLYREWCFGRFTAARISQKADLPNDFLEPDCSNLGLVLNRLQENHDLKKRLIEELRALYEGIQDYNVRIDGGTVQVFFQEQVNTRTVPISAARLSDGTLRYLCLLAILCHPDPPPLVCIEEPELGLHPDVLPNLAQLLKDASERTQLIVTTHSDVLVDAFTDQPDAVLVADRGENGTTLTRLDKEKLKPWLEKYRLGQLWTRGDIGGTRW